MKAFFFEGEKGDDRHRDRDPRRHEGTIAKKWRHDMIEKAAELDDHLMEKYLRTSKSPSSVTEIKRGLRKGTISRACYPVLCGAALRNIGVQMLLDACRLPPRPTEKPEVDGTDPRDKDQKLTRPHDPKAPFAALVFKVVSDTARRPHLHPHLLGQADQGHPPPQPRQQQA
jgi:elongation factor G